MGILNGRVASCILAIFISIQCATADPIRVGLETHSWDSLYAGRAAAESSKETFYANNLSKYGELNATWNVVRVSQITDGPDGFRRLKEILALHETNNVEVVIRLIEDPATYSSRSRSLSEMSDGILKYQDWIKQIATLVSGKVRIFLIGNEIDKDLRANLPRDHSREPIHITVSQYQTLFSVAYDTIKSIDAMSVVVDHGVESYSLLSAVILDAIERQNDEHAIDLCKRAFYGREEFFRECETFPRRLSRDKSLRLRAEKARQSFANETKADMVQLHLYFSSDVFSEVIAWIRSVQTPLQRSKPFIATEVGYLYPAQKKVNVNGGRRYADLARLSEVEYAGSLTRSILTLAALGVDFIEFWEMRTQLNSFPSPIATLYHSTNDPAEFLPYRAAESFKFLASILGNSETVDNGRRAINGLLQYSFRMNSGEIVSAYWSRDVHQSIHLKVMNLGPVIAYNMFGTELETNADTIEITREPTFIVFQERNCCEKNSFEPPQNISPRR